MPRLKVLNRPYPSKNAQTAEQFQKEIAEARKAPPTREEIIAANPIVDFVRGRGYELKAEGNNYVTDGCPVCKHEKRGHRPVTLYTETQ